MIARSSLVTHYGPWALVTGASEGIGAAFAETLARRNFGVVLVARRRSKLDELAARLASLNGGRTRVVDVDLAQAGAGEAIEDAVDGLDIGLLVAAAGFGSSGDLVRTTLATELEMIDVNCRAVVGLAHRFGTRFVRRGSGGIVLMSSLLAFQGVPGSANYAATKAFVQTFAEGLRRELKPLGVDVVASAPGPIRSGFAGRADLRMGLAQTPDIVADATLAALGRRTTVRPGWLAKALEGALVALPRGGRTWVMGRVMAGMTRHHHERDATQAA